MIGNLLRSKCDNCGKRSVYMAAGNGTYRCTCDCHKEKGK